MIATTVQESRAPYGAKAAQRTEPAERRVILHGISWDTYKLLLCDLGDSRSCRLAFNSGELEIMSPLFPHENSQFGIGQLVPILVDEFGLECVAAGSLTCEREDLQKGIEPDGCFYIQNFQRVRGAKAIDLAIHPPPDLMIEVDISTNSMSKLPICAALGVPEHWRFDGVKLEIRILKNGRYFESSESLAFPGVFFAPRIPEFVNMSKDGLISMQRKFRAWVREQLGKPVPSKSALKKSRKKTV